MKLPTIREAAQQLGVSDRKLYDALRRANVIGSSNIALPNYLREGFFVNAVRGRAVPRTNITRQYPVSLVTPAGLSLLQEIIDAEIKAGRELRIGHAADTRTAGAG